MTKNAIVVDNSLIFRADYKEHSVLLEDIKFIKSLSDYVTIHLNNTKYTFAEKTWALAKILPENFRRTHRSYILNLNTATKINSSKFKTSCGTEIPIGRAFK